METDANAQAESNGEAELRVVVEVEWAEQVVVEEQLVVAAQGAVAVMMGLGVELGGAGQVEEEQDPTSGRMADRLLLSCSEVAGHRIPEVGGVAECRAGHGTHEPGALPQWCTGTNCSLRRIVALGSCRVVAHSLSVEDSLAGGSRLDWPNVEQIVALAGI